MSPVLILTMFLPAADRGPPIVALAVSPDGKQVLAGSQRGIEAFAVPALDRVRSLPTRLEHVHDLAFSARGDWLAAAGGSPGERGAVEIWEWPAGTLRATFAAGDDLAYDVAWKGEGAELVVGGGDRTVRMLKVGGESDGSKGDGVWGERVRSDGTPTHFVGTPAPTTLRVHSAAVLSVAWLKGEDLILSASADQAIRVLKGSDGTTLRSLDNHTAAVRDLAVRPGAHPGPAVVASAGADRTVRFWQPAIGRLVRFARLSAAPTAICWDNKGTQVLAACEDGRVRAIDYETLAMTELFGTLDAWAHTIAALPGGQSVVVGGDAAASGDQGRLRIVPLNAINR
jgi:WD40 repeat protein